MREGFASPRLQAGVGAWQAVKCAREGVGTLAPKETPGVSVHPLQSSLRAITICCSRTVCGSPLPSPQCAHCCRRPWPAPTHCGRSEGHLPLLSCARRPHHQRRHLYSGELPGSPHSLCSLPSLSKPPSPGPSPLSLLSLQLPPACHRCISRALGVPSGAGPWGAGSDPCELPRPLPGSPSWDGLLSDAVLWRVLCGCSCGWSFPSRGEGGRACPSGSELQDHRHPRG